MAGREDGSKNLFCGHSHLHNTGRGFSCRSFSCRGFVGRLFREFGVVVAGAVLISAFVSLTLTPVLNVKLTKTFRHSRFYNATEPFFRRSWKMDTGESWKVYAPPLAGASIILICFGLIYYIGKDLQSELAPMEDKSNFRLLVSAPEGTSYDAMDKYMNKLSNFLMDSLPEKRYV